MDISNMPYDIYKYYFNVNQIKQAYEVQKSISLLIDKCENLISEPIITKLLEYDKDFKNICSYIINKENINSSETYDIALKTLCLINTNAQKLLYTKKHKINSYITDLKDSYNKIDKYISFSKNPEKLFLLYLLFIFILFISTSYLIFSNFAFNTFVYLSVPILFIIFVILPLIFYKWVEQKLKNIVNSIANKINNHKGQKAIIKIEKFTK